MEFDPALTTKLDFTNTNIRGTLSTTIGRLTNVRELTLIGGLTGALPTELGLLTQLSKLWIDSNTNLAGTIPSELGNLTKLRRFHLKRNPNLFGPIPRTFGKLKQLRQIQFNGNQLTGTLPTELAMLSQNLLILALEFNQFTGTIISELGQLSALKTLSIQKNTAFSKGSLPTTLGNLQNLVTLKVSNSSLIGALPSEMGLLSNLEIVQLNNNELTGSIPSQVSESLTNLVILDLYSNLLTGAIPLEAMTKLEGLRLQQNQFAGLVTLPGTAPFKTLALQGNKNLIGTIPSVLCDIPNLKILKCGYGQRNLKCPGGCCYNWNGNTKC